MRFPPQSRMAIATICLCCSAQAVQASAMARAPALEMILIVVRGLLGRSGRRLLSAQRRQRQQGQSCDGEGQERGLLHAESSLATPCARPPVSGQAFRAAFAVSTKPR